MANDVTREVKRRRAPAVAMQPREALTVRPRHVADRASLQRERRRYDSNIENDAIVPETFTLPLEAARLKVRDIITDIAQRGYREIVECWRQLPDGRIEFTMRRLPVGD
jgi:hypothetical protein